MIHCPTCETELTWEDSGKKCRGCDAKILMPQPGPQTMAAKSKASIMLLGGGVFGGKSYLLHMLASKYVGRRNFSGLFLRREAKMFKGAGGLWKKAEEFYPGLGGTSRESPSFDWKFDNGASIEFGGMERVKDFKKYEGNEYALIAIDEAQQFEASQILKMLQRNRAPAGYDGPCRMVLTCNPPAVDDPGFDLLHELVDWYIDEAGDPRPERMGVLRYFTVISDAIVWVDEQWTDPEDEEIGPKSFTFIQMLMNDNPIGMKASPEYRAGVRAQTQVEQDRKLKGNWKAQVGNSLFARGHVWWIDPDQVPTGMRELRYCDLASTTEEDAKVGKHSATGTAKGGLVTCPHCFGWRWIESEDRGEEAACEFCNAGGLVASVDVDEPGELLIITNLSELYGSPGEVEAHIRKNAARDGPSVPIYIEQEKGQAGKTNAYHYQTKLRAHSVTGDPVSGKKAHRAKPVVAITERAELMIVRSTMNDAIADALAKFSPAGKGPHADLIDAITGLYKCLLTHDWPVEFAWA